jgi:hypothetical protein
MNTMGQGREFTQDEKMFALQTIKMYRDTWSAREEENLKKDVLFKISNSDFDKLYKDHYDAQDNNEIERITEECIIAENASKNDQGEDEMNDEEKYNLIRTVRFKEYTKGFWDPEGAKEHTLKESKKAEEEPAIVVEEKPVEKAGSANGSQKGSQDGDEKDDIPPYTPLVPEFWKQKAMEFSQLHVVKYPRVFQSLIYFLHHKSREDICFKDTNMLSWKKATVFLATTDSESIYYKMNEYWPIGPKEGEYQEYQKLRFIKDNLADISEEDVDDYSVTVGKMFRWLNMALEIRIDDVTVRKKTKEKEKEFRADAVEKETERKQRFLTAFNEEKEAFAAKLEADKEEKKEKEENAETPADPEKEGEEASPEAFDEEEFRMRFDDENPPIEEPPEVFDDQDNDFNLELEEDEQE